MDVPEGLKATAMWFASLAFPCVLWGVIGVIAAGLGLLDPMMDLVGRWMQRPEHAELVAVVGISITGLVAQAPKGYSRALALESSAALFVVGVCQAGRLTPEPESFGEVFVATLLLAWVASVVVVVRSISFVSYVPPRPERKAERTEAYERPEPPKIPARFPSAPPRR